MNTHHAKLATVILTTLVTVMIAGQSAMAQSLPTSGSYDAVMAPKSKRDILQDEVQLYKDRLEHAKDAGMKPNHPDCQRIERMIAELEKKIAEADATTVAATNPIVAVLEAEVKTYEEWRKNAEIRGMKSTHPEYIRTERMIAELEKKIAVAKATPAWFAEERPGFVDDPAVIGVWRSVDFVKEPGDFRPGRADWAGELYLKELRFFENGLMQRPWFTWTKGMVHHSGDRTLARYDIREIDGQSYMFFEWMSGDVTLRGQKPFFYVLEKVDDPQPSPPAVSQPSVQSESSGHRESRVLTWPELQEEGKLLYGHILPVGSVPDPIATEAWQARQALRVSNADDPTQFPLVLLDNLSPTTNTFAVEGHVKHLNVEGNADLRMNVTFPDGTREVVRLERKITGSADWTPFSFSVTIDGTGPLPKHVTLELTLYMPGTGIIDLSPLRIVNLSPELFQRRNAWWSSQEAGEIGFLLAMPVVGLSFFVAIFLMRKPASHHLVNGLLWTIMALGAVYIAASIVAVRSSQPDYVRFPLNLIGVGSMVLVSLGGFTLRRQVRESELRKMRAMDMLPVAGVEETATSGNNESKPPYWFAAKRYGYGWGWPVTWQGWVFLLVWSAVTILATTATALYDMALGFAITIAMVVLLVIVCYKKGEPARWRWGDKE